MAALQSMQAATPTIVRSTPNTTSGAAGQTSPTKKYNDQLAIDKDEYLTRFPFYRHILNTHRELAAHFLFGDLSELTTTTAPTKEQVGETGLRGFEEQETMKPYLAN